MEAPKTSYLSVAKKNLWCIKVIIEYEMLYLLSKKLEPIRYSDSEYN